MDAEKSMIIRKNNWLMDFKRNITSIRGENGILEKVFEIIDGDKREKWCVEFGADDGKHSSNTWDFVINKGWLAVLIEADKKKFQKLVKTYENLNRVICLNLFINFSGGNSLDNVLAKTQIPLSFDLLSVDIDGNDYHIWDSLKKFNPKVVIIEFNPSFPNNVEFKQPKNMKIKQGSSILSIVNLGKKKGYEIVAATDINAVFVRKEYFSLFVMMKNFVHICINYMMVQYSLEVLIN